MTSRELDALRRKIIDGLATSGGFAEGLLGEKKATELLTAYTVRVLMEQEKVLAASGEPLSRTSSSTNLHDANLSIHEVGEATGLSEAEVLTEIDNGHLTAVSDYPLPRVSRAEMNRYLHTVTSR